jgi:hypothetical protein
VLNKSESWLTEAVRTEYAGSYMIERTSQEVYGAMKMIAGTAYMIRAALLRDLGWGTSLTEDWELTLRLYEKGYKVAYTPFAEVPAECVGTFARLARQRMRWAEGHTFNVRKHFLSILRSKHMTPSEKAEFLYFAIYYLQPAFFVVGTSAWLGAELVLHVHLPTWTALLGWSLLFSNFFSLPLMNLGGLFLEDAPRKDYGGIMGALALSFLLVPFQGWAALRGLFEKDEGPWHRTPKTGVITDPVHHMRRIRPLRRRLEGLRGRETENRPWPIRALAVLGGGGSPSEAGGRLAPMRAVASGEDSPLRYGGSGSGLYTLHLLYPVRPRAHRVGWIAVALAGALLVGLSYAAARAPVASASGQGLFLHTPTTGAAGNRLMDGNAPNGGGTTLNFSNGTSATWATVPASYVNGSIAAGTWAFQFFWSDNQCGGGGVDCLINVSIGYYSNCGTTCTANSLFSFPTGDINRSTTSPFTVSASEPQLTLSNCPCALFLVFTTTETHGNAFHLLFDGSSTPTNLSAPAVTVPESTLPFAGLALLLPALAARWYRANA